MPELPKELWVQISITNPTTYYKLLQVSKIFKLDTDMMKAKFIRKIEVNGDSCYKLPNGWLHSYNDQPSVIRGSQYWYIDGKQHRDNDLPAIIRADGGRYWYIDGKCHRGNDLPAVIWPNGSKFWIINGKQHRDNDLPAEVRASGGRRWYIDGKLHRGGDAPAILHSNDSVSWYIDGIEYTYIEYVFALLKRGIVYYINTIYDR